MLRNYLIYSYLLLITKLKIVYQNIKLTITNTESVKIVKNEEESVNNVRCRYYLIYLIDLVRRHANTLKNFVDINADKIQIIKNYNGVQKTIIIDSKKMNSKLTLSDALKYSSKISDIDQHDKAFVRFMIHTPNNSKCLKEYMLKYTDKSGEHHHTLDNIILFNKELCNSNNSDADDRFTTENCSNHIIEVVVFKNGKMNSHKFPFNKVRHEHINYFYDL